MTSPYLESTPILSLAERRKKLKECLAEIENMDMSGAGIEALSYWRNHIGNLRAALANLSED